MKIAEQIEREDIRWRILLCLQYSYISLLRESYILKILSDHDFTVTRDLIRQDLHYLEQKGLVKNVRAELALSSEWMSQLTAQGLDFVQYTTKENIPGIARPPAY